jgi:hypothetical protein
VTQATTTGVGEWRFDGHGVAVDELRAVDHDIATGVWPDMTEHGWPTDCSSLLNDAGQYAYDGRVGGCLLTGNEDGVKHCAMNVLYSLQHLGYTIPPRPTPAGSARPAPGPPTSTRARAVPRTTSPTATPPSRPGT